MSKKEKDDFKLYLRQLTDRQVQGCYDKEKSAGREEYAELAEDESFRRSIVLDFPQKGAYAKR